MLIQYKPSISPIIKAIIFGGCSAFVAEPIFSAIHFYELVHWKYYYSFPIYIMVYLIAHWISKRTTFKPL
ncbi:hypothetical protein ACFQDF_25425 [Ectobacillus funiculus]